MSPSLRGERIREVIFEHSREVLSTVKPSVVEVVYTFLEKRSFPEMI